MARTKPDIILVREMTQALEVAGELGAEGLGFDLEGVLEPFYGNNPDEMRPFTAFHENTLTVAAAVANRSISVPVGLMTNNTNHPMPGQEKGLVDLVAECIGGDVGPVPYVYKGMKLTDDLAMGKKPDGTQGVELARVLGVDPSDMVLIDDQWIKNFGEVVRSGMRAVIAPDPIGFLGSRERVIEHPGVMKSRRIEPLVKSGLETPRCMGRLAAWAAYRFIAGVSVSEIGSFKDLRTT